MNFSTQFDHTVIINEIEKSIKFYNWDFILSFLPKGSFLVGGYIRDIIMGRMKKEIDIDIVVPSNAIFIGQKISNKFNGKFIILDKARKVVRIIFNQISIDIASQISPTISEDLKSRDFSINSIAFLFDKKCLIDPVNGINDIQKSFLRTYSKINLKEDPLRILRCFRFVSDLNFKIDSNLENYLKQYKANLRLVAHERINSEIQRIVRGNNAIESILLIQKLNIFELENFNVDIISIDLKKINYQKLTQLEKQKFLPLFFLSQILDDISLLKLKFNKVEMLQIKLLRKWNLILREKNISEINELERFQLHSELEDILPAFIFYLPETLHLNWLKRWRDENDKLFHPSNLISGDVIKKYLKINDGPLLGKLLYYLSKELAFDRLNNLDVAIYKAKQWIEQNAPKCD